MEFIIPLLQTVGQQVVASYMDKKASKRFLEDVQKFTSIYTDLGHLATLPPTKPVQLNSNPPAGWTMTKEKGCKVIYWLYPDIRNAF